MPTDLGTPAASGTGTGAAGADASASGGAQAAAAANSAAAVTRKSAALTAPFLPLAHMLQTQAALNTGIEQAATNATQTVMSYLESTGTGEEPPDEKLWDKFIEDLDNTFNPDMEWGGANSSICTKAWAEAMGNHGRLYLQVVQQEREGKMSHQNAEVRLDQITGWMKTTTQTWLRCLSQPPRKQQVPQAGGGG